MKKNKTKEEIISFIESELHNIKQLNKDLNSCKGNSIIVKRARGSILHDFYNACERIFENISREVNGGVPESQQWHKKLLHQMTLPIKNVRPAIISKRLAAELDEYLAFRHLFRNIYGFELEGERLNILVEKFGSVAKLFNKEIKDFLKKL